MGKKVIKLRRATPDDVVQIIGLVNTCWIGESDVVYPPIEPNAAGQWVYGVVVHNWCYVADCDDDIVGSIGLQVDRFPWNNSVHFLKDGWLMVKPDFRAGGVTSKLIDQAKIEAEERQMPLFMGILNANKDTEAKERFYRMQGFRYIGGHFEHGMPEKEKDEADGPIQVEQGHDRAAV